MVFANTNANMNIRHKLTKDRLTDFRGILASTHIEATLQGWPRKKRKITSDMLHMTHDKVHVTCDTWWEVNLL